MERKTAMMVTSHGNLHQPRGPLHRNVHPGGELSIVLESPQPNASGGPADNPISFLPEDLFSKEPRQGLFLLAAQNSSLGENIFRPPPVFL